MSDRRPLIAANWKMNKTKAEAEAFLEAFLPKAGDLPDVDVVICAPFTALDTVAARTAGGPIVAAAQNMHGEPSGAFTGEISAPMLLELGVGGVVLGHSERRQLFGETDAAVQRKVPAALRTGLEGPKNAENGDSKRERTRFLPDNIYDAIRLFKNSEFMEQILGKGAFGKEVDHQHLGTLTVLTPADQLEHLAGVGGDDLPPGLRVIGADHRMVGAAALPAAGDQGVLKVLPDRLLDHTVAVSDVATDADLGHGSSLALHIGV